MHRRLSILGGCLLAVVLAVLGPEAGARERDLGTGYQLENVEVMDPSMGLKAARRHMMTFNEALGMKCRDCHVLRDFPSDEKPIKLVAREMMKMTRDLNEQWFSGSAEDIISCWTCHAGERRPSQPPEALSAPPAPRPESEPVGEPTDSE